MKTFRLRNTVLPAFLVSSAVFSALTLPFIWLKSEPLIVELQPLFKGELQPVFESENKDIVIRYIGFSIVASVGAGLTTIEVLRRQQRARELAQPQRSVLEPQPALPLPTNHPEVPEPLDSESEIVLSDLLMEGIAPEVQSIGFEAVPYNQQTAGGLSETTALEQDYLLSPRQQYTTCRIKVPYLERRLFAIRLEDQYYSFFRTSETKEEALEVATKLNQKGSDVVVTQTEQGYAVWVWEQDANQELATSAV